MTPGPEPHEAIRQAMKNAAARGNVIHRDLLKDARFPFIIFCACLTIFVRVRRTRSHLTSPEDCAAEYRMDILRLRRVPLTGVVARELWLLSPWGTWQYFRILDDRVIEIRADGTPMVTGGVDFTKVPDPAAVADFSLTPVPDPAPDSTSAPVPDSVPAPVLASIPDPVPTPVPDPAPAPVLDPSPDSSPAPVPDRASLPGLSPVESSPSSDEGG